MISTPARLAPSIQLRPAASIASSRSSTHSLSTRRRTSSSRTSSLRRASSQPDSSSWASSSRPALSNEPTDDDDGSDDPPRAGAALMADARSSDLDGFFFVCLIMRWTLVTGRQGEQGVRVRMRARRGNRAGGDGGVAHRMSRSRVMLARLSSASRISLRPSRVWLSVLA